MATYIRRGRINSVRSRYSSFCASYQIFRPYPGTPHPANVVCAGNMTNYNLNIAGFGNGKGLPAFSNEVSRTRMGFSFPLLPSYPGGTRFRIVVKLDTFRNTLESFSPQIYISNTDDSSLYSSNLFKPAWNWELNLNNNLGLLTYGTTTEQSIVVNPALITPLLGTHLSIVLGSDRDFAGSGVASGSVFQYADFLPAIYTVSALPFWSAWLETF